jgi:hypothetical protein
LWMCQDIFRGDKTASGNSENRVPVSAALRWIPSLFVFVRRNPFVLGAIRRSGEFWDLLRFELAAVNLRLRAI